MLTCQRLIRILLGVNAWESFQLTACKADLATQKERGDRYKAGLETALRQVSKYIETLRPFTLSDHHIQNVSYLRHTDSCMSARTAKVERDGRRGSSSPGLERCRAGEYAACYALQALRLHHDL